MQRIVKLLPEKLRGSRVTLGVFVYAVITCAVGGWAYSSGHRAGRVSQLRDQVSAYNRRMGLDDKSNALGQVFLCRELGGMLEECQKIGRCPTSPLRVPARLCGRIADWRLWADSGLPTFGNLA
ncbi:hypothetical protein NKH19_26560 [Mesorhizobium sp. M1338]|uniref:hypothetical protein n=1 Tax=unclassified Mesorhizobium TaxID=325217 RepID=UPI00333824E6